MTPIKLVLSGCGMRYPLHAGGVMRLQETYTITDICGTSGGSIIAAAVASGYNGSTLEQLVLSTDPKTNGLIDVSVFGLLFRGWGLVKGNKIEMFMRDHFAATFKDTKIPLSVVTTNLSQHKQVVFSSSSTPDMSVSRAVRVSLSIPGVFKAVDIGGDLYVDGGVMDNFDLDVFGDGEGVMGLRMGGEDDLAPPERITGVEQYIGAVVSAMFSSMNRAHIQDATKAKVIALDSKGFKSLNLNMTMDDIKHMIELGYSQVDDFLKNG